MYLSVHRVSPFLWLEYSTKKHCCLFPNLYKITNSFLYKIHIYASLGQKGIKKQPLKADLKICKPQLCQAWLSKKEVSLNCCIFHLQSVKAYFIEFLVSNIFCLPRFLIFDFYFTSFAPFKVIGYKARSASSWLKLIYRI